MRVHIQNHAGDGNPTASLRQWQEAVARAGEAGEDFQISLGQTGEEFAAALGEAQALITSGRTLKAPFPAEAPHLKLIFLTHAGVDSVAASNHIPAGVKLLNNRGTHTDKGGEYALMAVLMLANHLPFFVNQQGQGRWERRFASSVAGRRATVVGLGAIGAGIARHLHGLGMHVTGVRMRPAPHPHCDLVVANTDLDTVLPRTEFLILACPLTPLTAGLLNKHRIGLLPPGAGVVNIGRGELVEQDALLDALDSGRLGGAVLDVFIPEPVPAGHRLWTTRNLIMTPHMSSGDPVTYIPRSLDLFIADMHAFRTGRTMQNEVDLGRGY